jgi:hypothetical protein
MSRSRHAFGSADNPAKWLQSLLWRFGRLSYAQVMLPFFRIIPVGGVFLAIMIVVLALDRPGGSHTALTPAAMPARGAMMRMNEHPEWRQFLILAAVRRADELSRLRELPDTPVRDAGQVTGKVAGLPTGRSDSDPEDETGTFKEMPRLTLPLDIGETSSMELTVILSEEKPPERKAPSASRRKTPQRARQAKARAKTQPAAQSNLLETIFGGQRASQPAVQSGPTSTIRADQY